jgi:hypothetical protein
MPDHSFAERFKRLEPVDLITIIKTPHDYQPEAVDAAKQELEGRQLTEVQLAEANAIYDGRIHEAQVKEENWKQVKGKAQHVAREISPVQFGPQTTDKYIRSVTVFAGVYFAYMVYRQFSYFSYSLSENFTALWLLYELLPLAWLGIGGVLFGLKRKWGWALMAAFFWRAAIGSAFGLFFMGLENSAKGAITALIFGAAFYAIMNKEVREIFRAERNVVIAVIVVGSILAVGPWFFFIGFM